MSATAEISVSDAVAALETDLLLEALVRRWGYDLRGYERRPAQRRVEALLRASRLPTASALQERVLRDAAQADRLVAAVGGTRRPLFGDASFWTSFRMRVVPYLRTYPSPKVWLPACGTGEDAWAAAIVLEEEGLGERCEVYATDLEAAGVAVARSGRIALGRLRAAERRHAATGGRHGLSRQFEPRGREASLVPRVRERLVFGTHSLATDGQLNEFQFVLLRGTLPRFGAELRRRVLRLVLRSTCPLGLVALDPGTPTAGLPLEPWVPEHGVWRRAS